MGGPYDFWDGTGAEEGMVRLFINIPEESENVRRRYPRRGGGESQECPGKLVGCIDMYDKYTFVEVPKDRAMDVLTRWMIVRR